MIIDQLRTCISAVLCVFLTLVRLLGYSDLTCTMLTALQCYETL